MKQGIRAIACAAVALALPGAAFALTDGSAQYDDCMLNALRESRNGAAAQLIQRSCDALYRNNAMLLPRERFTSASCSRCRACATTMRSSRSCRSARGAARCEPALNAHRAAVVDRPRQ